MAKIPYRDPVQALNDVAEGRLQLYWAALAIVRGAIAGRPRQAPRDHVERAVAGRCPDMPTVGAGRLPRADLRRPGRLLRHARHAGRAARADRRRRPRRRSPIRRSCSRLQATGQDVVPGSAAEFAAAIDKQRAGVAEIAKVLGIKAAQ